MENSEIKMKDGNDICDEHILGEITSEFDEKVYDNIVISIDKILEEQPWIIKSKMQHYISSSKRATQDE